MVNYGLKDKVVLITGTNNPQGIGAASEQAGILTGNVNKVSAVTHFNILCKD